MNPTGAIVLPLTRSGSGGAHEVTITAPHMGTLTWRPSLSLLHRCAGRPTVIHAGYETGDEITRVAQTLASIFSVMEIMVEDDEAEDQVADLEGLGPWARGPVFGHLFYISAGAQYLVSTSVVTRRVDERQSQVVIDSRDLVR